MNVYQKLNEARSRFHQLKLKKTGRNTFAGYEYFELGDFLIPAMGVFRDVGLCAVVSFEADTARMTIIDAEKPDQSIVITSPMGSANLKGCHEVQNIGAVETYQRRYLWVAALEIVEHDALDATTGANKPSVAISPAQELKNAAAKNISEQRQSELEDAALTMVEAFGSGNGMAAHEIWRSVSQADQEEGLFLWGLLSKESKLRAFLKAQKGTQ